MRAHITGGVVALWFSFVGVAGAQGHEGHEKGNRGNPKSEGAGATRDHLERAQEELGQAGDAAAKDTLEALKKARDEARAKLREARDAALKASEEARAKGQELSGEAREQARKTVDLAREAVTQAEEALIAFNEQARSQKELERAADAAAKDALVALKKARDLARTKLREARDEALKASEQARAKGQELSGEAREQSRKAVDLAREAVTEAEAAIHAFSQQARSAWQAAGNSFNPDSPEGKRQARRSLERQETWKRLREQMKAKDREATSQLEPPLKTELAVHARRSARLVRIREVALENKDSDIVSKVDTLLERERTRHERRVETLTAHAEPGAAEGE